MKVNKKRVAIFGGVSLLLSIVYSTSVVESVDESFLGAMYTVVGVIFSIGMSMLYSLNPGRLKNEKMYTALKNRILLVRDTSFVLFSLLSVLFVISVCVNTDLVMFSVYGLQIYFSLSNFSVLFNILTIIYLAFNFLVLQDLNYQIEDSLREST